MSSTDFYRDIDDVVETVCNANVLKRKCALLIGAGCSVTAGIPAAAGIVEQIRKTYPRAYDRAKAPKNYPCCMEALSLDARRSMIATHVDKAKINWAHLAIAQLINRGYVDRVLTTNFDPLVLRACAMLGFLPAVYDFAMSQHFKPDFVADPSVFHLHGQHTGFVLLNTQEEVCSPKMVVSPLLEDTDRNRVWIVVGYSGEQDPVFEQLKAISRFDGHLYWIGYQDAEPAAYLQKDFLGKSKGAFYVKGYDADGFFVTLAQKLGCFPPDFVGKPFSHLRSVMEEIVPYSPPGQTLSGDICEHTRTLM